MQRIKDLILKFISRDPPKKLGRWNIEYCNNKLNTKIDLSNEDHCGPCGKYAINKIADKILQDKNVNNMSKK